MKDKRYDIIFFLVVRLYWLFYSPTYPNIYHTWCFDIWSRYDAHESFVQGQATSFPRSSLFLLRERTLVAAGHVTMQRTPQGARLNLVTSAIKFYRLEGQIVSALCSEYWQKIYTWASPSISKHQNVDIIQNNFNTNLDSGVKLSYSSCCPKESICCRFLLKDSIWKEQLLHQVRKRSLESSQIRTTLSFSHWNGWHVEKSQVSQNYHPI